MSIQLLSDNELVQRYIGGHEDSLSILLQRHKRKIFSSIIMASVLSRLQQFVSTTIRPDSLRCYNRFNSMLCHAVFLPCFI